MFFMKIIERVPSSKTISQQGSEHELPGHTVARSAEASAPPVPFRVSADAGAGSPATAPPGRIQRELATPLPETTPEAQTDLSERQIRLAIVHNSARYQRPDIEHIQDLIGTETTGRFNRDDILAIASIQEEYGLHKDGLLGPETYRFLDHEQALEGTGDEDDHIISFAVIGPDRPTINIVPTGSTFAFSIRGHFRVEAMFPSRGNTGQYEYRQFIQGWLNVMRGTTTQDMATAFNKIPGGQLPFNFVEDGNTSWPMVNYGHRNRPGQANTTSNNAENHYTDPDGTENQASGSVYKGEDFPGCRINNLNSGDNINISVEFRGEIRRNGRVVRTKRWKGMEELITI